MGPSRCHCRNLVSIGNPRCQIRFTQWTLRSYASSRVAETGELPAAGDILYKNPEAIANRLKLFHMLRLQTQERLDQHALQSMTTTHEHDLLKDETAGKDCVRLTTYLHACLPGVERQFDPKQGRVSIKASLPMLVKRLSLDVQKLRVLAQSAEATKVTQNYLTITVQDFPFRKQNRLRALSIVRDLIHESGNQKVFTEATEAEASLPPPKRKSRVVFNRRFPDSWLPRGPSTTAPQAP